jgi:hypothetical protein
MYARAIGSSEAGRRIHNAGVAYQRRHPDQPPEIDRRREWPVHRLPTPGRRAVKPASKPKRDWLLIPPTIAPAPSSDCQAIERIIADATRLSGVTRQVIESPIRRREAVIARHYVMQRFHDELAWSSPKIGRALGGRDHTTVFHALTPKNRQRVQQWLVQKAGSVGSGG